MKALILAAGYATRLYPLTKEYPKSLLRVKKKPIINYILDKLRKIDDIDEIIVVTNSKFMPQFRKWAKAIKIKKRLSLVDDLTRSHADRRGAIGDMNFVIDREQIQDDLLVLGGDNLFDMNLNEFLSFAQDKSPNPVIGVYNIEDIHQASKYGVAKLNSKKQVIDFVEKPIKPKSTLAAMCLYYFPKEKLEFIKEYITSKIDKHDATGFYIDWLRKKVPVYGFVFKGRWYDIGDHHFYRIAKERFIKK